MENENKNSFDEEEDEFDLSLDSDEYLDESLPHVSFGTNGKGKWWKTEYPIQCKHKCFLSGRCQDVEGHKGYHWSYSPKGDYLYAHNDNDPQEDAEINACGMCPPGSRGYVWPGKKKYYMDYAKHSEVTDPKEIERLEKGEFALHESVNRPVKMDDEHFEEIMKRVKESDEISERIRKNRSLRKKFKDFLWGVRWLITQKLKRKRK